MATSLLDLIGVLLIGAVTALSVSAVSGGPVPNPVTNVIMFVGLGELGVTQACAVLAVIAGVLLVGKSVFSALIMRRVLQFLAHRQAEVSGGMTRALLNESLSDVQRMSSQETAYALTAGVNFATLIILSQAVVLVSETALLLVLAMGLLIISPIVTLFTAGFFLLVAVILQRMLSGRTERLGRTSSKFEVLSFEAIQASIRGFRELLVTDRREDYADRIEGYRWQVASVQAGLQYMSLAPKFVFEVALVVGAGLLVSSQLLTKDLAGAVGVIAIFLAAGSRVVPSMLRLQGAALAIRGAGGQAVPTYELAAQLGYAPDITVVSRVHRSREIGEAANSRASSGCDLAICGIHYTYPGSSNPALTGITLEAHAGSSLAIVGRTGCGKSTLADVLLGVLEPDEGSIRIGGVSPKDAVHQWPGALGYVPQIVTIVKGSVLENVGFGIPEADIDSLRVWEVLEQVQLADYLRAQREGLETELAEDSIRLSGGQRQRLGLARALYSKPRVLVLDEATSALDMETELAIGHAIEALEGSVTLVVIAHRLSTIRLCDNVAYMEHGRVLANGTFDEVVSECPAFARQVQLSGI